MAMGVYRDSTRTLVHSCMLVRSEMGGNADSVWLNAFPEREFARCSEDCRELNRTRFPNAIHQQNPNVVSRSLPTMSDTTTDR